MTTEIVTLPLIGTLTATEVHALALGLVGLFIGGTRAWAMIRAEPWYFVFSLAVCTIAGILVT